VSFDTSNSDRLPDPHLTHQVRLFPHRSPRQASTNAAVGGLEPPPAGRLRRAYLHLPCSTASRSSTYIKLPSTFGTQHKGHQRLRRDASRASRHRRRSHSRRTCDIGCHRQCQRRSGNHPPAVQVPLIGGVRSANFREWCASNFAGGILPRSEYESESPGLLQHDFPCLVILPLCRIQIASKRMTATASRHPDTSSWPSALIYRLAPR
jgi:hypothetical protein